MNDVEVISLKGLQNEVRYGINAGQSSGSFIIDEPVDVGGEGAGPDPYSLLLAALGGCTSMTITLYARRKGWPLESVKVGLSQERVHSKDCNDCETKVEGFVHRIERTLEFEGPLTDEQKTRLREIAAKCPIHKTLSAEILVKDVS